MQAVYGRLQESALQAGATGQGKEGGGMTECVHRWLLEEGTRNVPGRCAHCGEERTFRGFADVLDSMDAPFSPHGRRHDPKRVRSSQLRGAAKRGQTTGEKHSDFTHGTSYGYRRRQCRCEACKAWSHEVQAARWARKKAAKAA